jgi:hypothetical protein
VLNVCEELDQKGASQHSQNLNRPDLLCVGIGLCPGPGVVRSDLTFGFRQGGTVQDRQDNRLRPRESLKDNCLPLGLANNHLGSLCWFRQECLLEPGKLCPGPHWVTLCKSPSLSSDICKMGIIIIALGISWGSWEPHVRLIVVFLSIGRW